MIVELYRDQGEIDKDGAKIPYVNHAHEWWVRFDGGSTRPATETEVQLWQEMQEAKTAHDHCAKLAWELYAAAMGVTVTEFNGLPGSDPVSVVKEERKRLLAERRYDDKEY